jgi:hypothetical protein
MVHYETFSIEGIKSFGKIFLDMLATIKSSPFPPGEKHCGTSFQRALGEGSLLPGLP